MKGFVKHDKIVCDFSIFLYRTEIGLMFNPKISSNCPIRIQIYIFLTTLISYKYHGQFQSSAAEVTFDSSDWISLLTLSAVNFRASLARSVEIGQVRTRPQPHRPLTSLANRCLLNHFVSLPTFV
jgi:hypothetical protein